MKRVLLILLIITLALGIGCGAPNGGSKAPGYEHITGAEITDEGLNNLRDVVGKNWGYALVARDCIFNEYGYYKFEDVLEYNVKGITDALGEEWEREVFFARGEDSVYGVYRINDGENCDYYAFTGDYTDATVNLRYLGKYNSNVAHVGYEGDDSCRLILIGNRLIAYDFKNFERLSEVPVSLNFDYGDSDFTFWQKGKACVFFTPEEDRKTHVYAFDTLNGITCVASMAQDYSGEELPAVIGDCYLFNEDALVVLSADSVLEEGVVEEIKSDYLKYVTSTNSAGISADGYEAYVEGETAVVKRTEDGSVLTVTVADVIQGCGEVLAIKQKRGETPEITDVKIVDGEIFIILEKEPETFEGIRDVNDGIPQTLVRFDFNLKTFTFCGMVDFTGYAVYRIVKL